EFRRVLFRSSSDFITFTQIRNALDFRDPLRPYPADLMDAHDVSTIVNSAKYDGPECIRPVADDLMPNMLTHRQVSCPDSLTAFRVAVSLASCCELAGRLHLAHW